MGKFQTCCPDDCVRDYAKMLTLSSLQTRCAVASTSHRRSRRDVGTALVSLWTATVPPLPLLLRKPAGAEKRAPLLTLGCSLEWLQGSMMEQGLLGIWS